MFQRRPLRTIAASITIAAALQAAPHEASAITSDQPFTCDGTPYIMQDGDLYVVEQDPDDSSRFVFRAINLDTEFGNSLAYDPATNLLYGVRDDVIETYDASGAVLNAVPFQSPWPSGSGTYAATTLGDGRYVVAQYNQWYKGAKNNLWTIDPSNGAATYIGRLAKQHSDIAFNPTDGYIYHVTGGHLYRIDPRSGAQEKLPIKSGLGSHGSSWFDPAGNLYLHHNSTGSLYQVTEIGSEKAQWRKVGTTDPVLKSDGANCIGGLDIEQTSYGPDGEVLGSDTTVAPGETITQVLTVYNNQQLAETTTLTICDSLSGQGSFNGIFSSSNNSGTLISGGEAGSTEFCYTIDSPSSLWIDPDNGGAEPIEITLEIAVGQTPSSTNTVQAWIEIDGNIETQDVKADNTGTATEGDATVINVAGLDPTLPPESEVEPTPEPEVESTPEPEVESTPESEVEPVPLPQIEPPVLNPDTFIITDSGLGTGASCPVYGDEAMLPRASVDNVVVVSEPTSLLAGGFNSLSAVSILSGVWEVDNGKLSQLNDCGNDYTALLNTDPVEHFQIEATYSSIDTGNNSGITFGVSGPDTRSGATLVDLADDGQTLRWGYYDDAGFYQFVGSADVGSVAVGQAVTLSIEVHGQDATINLNGDEIASFEARNSNGYVGLVSNLSTVAYDQVNLTALPAP